jgi:hypothetical protein
MAIPYPSISFEAALEDLRSWDWEHGDLKQLLSRLGTALPEYFKQNNLGGIDLQQVPSELEKLIRFLWTHHPRLSSYFEVGVGKFGNFLVLNESWKAKGIRPSLCVADNFSQDNEEQKRRFEFVKQHYSVESFIGNTASDEFERFLTGRSFEVILIDGDHSFSGCMSDLITCYKHLQPGGTLIMHDITSGSCPGVQAVFTFAKKYFESSETFSDSSTCGLGILMRPKFDAIPDSHVLLASWRYAAKQMCVALSDLAKRVERKIGRFWNHREFQ